MNVKKLKGRVDFEGKDILGYVLWKQSDGFHLRWTTSEKKTVKFQGKITFNEKFRIIKKYEPEDEDKIKEPGKNTIEWDSILKKGTEGLDFLTPGTFSLELRLNKKKVKPVSIFLGPEMIQPENNPFDILQTIKEYSIPESVHEPAPEPVYEPIPEPISEPVNKPEPELIPESVHEPVPELTLEQVYEPISELIPEPVHEPAPEPVYEPIPEPISEPVNKPEPELIPEPVHEPVPELTLEQVYEPELEPTPEIRVDDMNIRLGQWLTQLVTYRDFTPKKEIAPEPEIIYECLPETPPEPVYQPEIALEPVNEPEPETKVDPNKNIYDWLIQLARYRKNE